MKSFLERLVGRLDYWRHNDPRLSECDRKNAASHLRAMVSGATHFQSRAQWRVDAGELAVHHLAELDGPRERSVHVQVRAFPRSPPKKAARAVCVVAPALRKASAAQQARF